VDDHVITKQIGVRSAGAVQVDVRRSKVLVPLTMQQGAGGLVGWCAVNKELVNVHSCYDDDRFDAREDRDSSRTTHTMLCVPVLNAVGGLLGVLQVVNKHGGNPDSPFTGVVVLHYLADRNASHLTGLHCRGGCTSDGGHCCVDKCVRREFLPIREDAERLHHNGRTG